jgi:hypothetical protein
MRLPRHRSFAVGLANTTMIPAEIHRVNCMASLKDISSYPEHDSPPPLPPSRSSSFKCFLVNLIVLY